MNEFQVNLLKEGIITIFDIVLIYYWAKAFEKKRQNKWIKYTINMSAYLIFLLATLFYTNPMVLFLVSFFIIFVIVYYGNRKLLISCVLSLGLCLVFILSEGMSSFLLMALKNTDLNSLRFTEETRLIIGLISKLFALIFIGFIYFKKRNRFNLPKNRIVFYFMALPISSIIILYQMSRYDYSSTNVGDGLLNLISITGLILANITIFVFFEKEFQYETQKKLEFFLKEQVKNQREYYKNLEASQDEIRHLRHDMKNAFIALKGLIEQERLEEAKRYLENFTQVMRTNTQRFYITGYSGIDALINSKMIAAKEKNIEIKHKLFLPENLKIDEMDLCIILGNALDNGIEGMKAIEKEEKYLIINGHVHQNELFLYIENDISEKIIEENGKLISTKKDRRNHGFGLKNIKRIVSLYHGEIHYKIENNKFRLYVTLKIQD